MKSLLNSKVSIAVLLTLLGASAQAVVLSDYQFTGASAAATSAASDLDAGNFSFNAAMDNSNTGFSSAGNIFARVTGTSSTTLAGAITSNQYVTVTITPDIDFQLNLTNLTVDLGYSLAAASVPDGVGVNLGASVFSSVDGFTEPDVLATQTFIAADTSSETGGILYQNVDIDLSGVAYQGLTDSLEFRIYLYDNEDAETQPIFRIDNFTLNGTVAAVPEPSSFALLAGCFSLAWIMVRRRS